MKAPAGKNGRWDRSKHSVLFPQRLHNCGYTRYGIRRGVNPVKHLLRAFGNVPALDEEAVSFWEHEGNVTTVYVHLTDGRTMVASLNDVANGKRINFGGHGSQIVTRAWRFLDSRQLNLF